MLSTRYVEDYPSYFFKAVYDRDYDKVKSILTEDENVDIDEQNIYGSTPLIIAVRRGHKEIVKLLLEQKADPTIIDNRYQAPIFYAEENDDIEIITELILHSPVDCEYKVVYFDENYDYSSFYASDPENYNEDYEKERLAERNLHRFKYADKKTPLGFALYQQDNLNIVKDLLNNGHNINKPSENFTPLMLSASIGDEDMTVFLLENKANINDYNDSCQTALCMASMNGHIDIVKILLERKALTDIEPNRKSMSCLLPLDMACTYHHTDIMKLLLKAGANPNNKNFRTGLLNRLDEYNDLDAVKMLVKYGYNITGEILVKYYESNYHRYFDYGLSIMDKKKLGETLIYIASKGFYLGLLVYLSKIVLDKGADVNYIDENGQTALMYACKRKEKPKELIELLTHKSAIQMMTDLFVEIPIVIINIVEEYIG